MWSILHMAVMSLAVVVVPRTGKFMKNALGVFERGETKWCYYILCLIFCQSSENNNAGKLEI